MLVLNRRVTESVLIGDDIVITVTRVRGKSVRIAIDAPRSVAVGRLEPPRKGRLGEASVSRPTRGVDAEGVHG